MKARTAIATALTLVTLAAPAAQATIPSDHEGGAPSKPVLKHLPQTREGFCTTNPTRSATSVSAPSSSAPYLVSAAAVRRNG
jgi:hypothetical protein